MSQKKALEKERGRVELRNRISRLSVPPSSRSSSVQPPSRPLQSPSLQPRLSRSSRLSQPLTIEESIESIDRKLDDLLIRQQRLEKQISDLKESLYNQNTNFSAKDKKFIDVIEVFEIFERFCIYMICTNFLF